MSENVRKCVRYDSFSLWRVRISDHCVSFSSSLWKSFRFLSQNFPWLFTYSLSIGQDCAIVALENLIDNRSCCVDIQVNLKEAKRREWKRSSCDTTARKNYVIFRQPRHIKDGKHQETKILACSRDRNKKFICNLLGSSLNFTINEQHSFFDTF